MIVDVCGVYRITCTANGRFYIGSSVDANERWSAHWRELGRGKHVNPKMQAAWNKYGGRAFICEMLECAPSSELLLVEQRWMDEQQPWFNVAKYADAPMRGRLASPEHRAAISRALVGNGYHCGKTASDETKAKMREAQQKRRASQPVSEATRQKLRAKGQGHVVSAETRAKLSQKQREHQTVHGNPMSGRARPDLSERNRHAR